MFKCDGVDILVEDEGKRNYEVENVESLRPNGVRQNFNRVRNNKWSKRDTGR